MQHLHLSDDEADALARHLKRAIDDDLRILGEMFGISPTNIPLCLTYLIGPGVIFFVVAAALTRFVGWVVRGFVSSSRNRL
jgi:hypothetical protein